MYMTINRTTSTPFRTALIACIKYPMYKPVLTYVVYTGAKNFPVTDSHNLHLIIIGLPPQAQANKQLTLMLDSLVS